MRIAMPVRGACVSSTFDFARTLLLVELEDDREARRMEMALVPEPLIQKAERLRNLQVDVLICGAISQALARAVWGASIKIFPYVTGRVDEVLGAYVSGRLAEPRYALPGCWRGARNDRQQRQRRRRGHEAER
jgi:predicted Fe-Mo cluster-binding NifX family protein